MGLPVRGEPLAFALRRVVADPAAVLVRHWHWKVALVSASLRALLFLGVTWRAGWRAAAGAMGAEFILRVATTGFCGSFTQSLRHVEPAWQGALVTLVALPLSTQALEFFLHWSRGTPNLRSGIGLSTVFTVLSTLFHLYSTRHGAYLTGPGAAPMADDLRRTPALLAGFLTAGWYRPSKTETTPNVSKDS